MVGFQVQYFFFPIGSADFLHSFFSTVSYHLEYRKWGSRFPVIMNEVYQGYLLPEHAEQAREELSVITAELKNLKPHQIIWDIDDLSKEPPWEVPISEEITDLANYFITSDGADFITIFNHALLKAIELQFPLEIHSKKYKSNGGEIWPEFAHYLVEAAATVILLALRMPVF